MQAALKEGTEVKLPGGLGRIFEAHHALVFRTAYRITGNVADAEDVLQTIFLRLLRNRQTAGAVSHEESYLRRAAINVALDLIRLRQQDRTVPLMDIPSENPDVPVAEWKAALRRALTRLSPKSAEVFAFRFFEGFSNRQIAQMLGISQVSVAVIVHRARQKLRRELGAYVRENR